MHVGTDGADNAYVADSENHRVQRFDALGTFERTWGKDVNMTTGASLCTAASGDTCKMAATGGLGGEMTYPYSVGIDTAGNVYVADQIARFDVLGTFERTWGKAVNLTTGGNICTALSGNTCQAGTAGAFGGEMNGPAGVAAGTAGTVYVADTSNHRIQRFNDPVSPTPVVSTPPSAATGRRATALKKCKKKRSKKARNKCKKKANLLPA